MSQSPSYGVDTCRFIEACCYEATHDGKLRQAVKLEKSPSEVLGVAGVDEKYRPNLREPQEKCED